MTASPSDPVTVSPAAGSGVDLRLVAPAVGCWAVTVLGVVAAPVAAGVVSGVCAVGATVGWFVARSRVQSCSRAAHLLLVVVATAGITAGFGTAITVRAVHLQRSPMAADELVGHKVTVVLTIVDDPRALRGPGPARVRIAVRAVPATSGAAPVAATLTAPESVWSEMVPGQRAVVVVAVDRPYRSDLTAAALRATTPPQAVARAPTHQRWATGVRTRFAEQSRRALPAAESGLLPGLVVGDTSGLPPEVSDDFRAAGLTHLVAVSGANFAIVCGTVLLTLRTLGVRRVPAAIVTMAVLGCFVVVVRPSPSVVRAAVMGLVGLLAMVADRGSSVIPALSVAVIAVLGIWPAMAVDPGFALSVAATAGLIALAPRIREWLCARGLPRMPAELLAVAIAAQIVTLPLVVMISGSVGLLGVVANIAVAPAVAPITVLGTLAATSAGASTVVTGVLVRFCEPPLWWMIHVAEVVSRAPGATVAVPDGVVGALLATAVIVAGGVAVHLVGTHAGRVVDRAGGAASVRRGSTIGVVTRVWQHERRDRSTASAPRRRRLPRRTRHRRHPRGGDRRRRRTRPPGDPGTRR